MEKLVDEFLLKIGANTITGLALLLILRAIFLSVFRKFSNRMAIVEDKQDAMVHGLKSCRTLNGQFTDAYEAELKRIQDERDRENVGVNDFMK